MVVRNLNYYASKLICEYVTIRSAGVKDLLWIVSSKKIFLTKKFRFYFSWTLA